MTPNARWLVVADDLTGAADGAVAFAGRGLSATVRFAEAPADDACAVLSCDADSRHLSPEHAAGRQRAILERLMTADRRLFLKIDSTLRGQPAAAIAATLRLLATRGAPAFGVLAPAFPALGRATRDGRVWLHGRPLERSELWKREHAHADADLLRILGEAGVPATLAPLAKVRDPGALAQAFAAAAAAAAEAHVVVCDAETDDDLRMIAGAGLAASKGPVFIGSAGLTHALAAATPARGRSGSPWTLGRQGALIVAGSPASACLAAAHRLASQDDVVDTPVGAAALLDGEVDLAPIGAGLAAGRDVLVHIEPSAAPDLSEAPRLAAALAEALAPLAGSLGALALTGGATAAAVMRRFGIDGIHIMEEIEPGVPLGRTLGAIEVPIATKAGAFGDEHTLTRIAARLRRLRQEGTEP